MTRSPRALHALLCLLFTLMALSPSKAVGVDTPALCVSTNGDTNADQDINVTDAITILGHLFLGNPTKLPRLCASQLSTIALPATGQTKCYNGDGQEVPCGSACSGQDAEYNLGCPSEGRFVDNGDGTVTDNCTGLMWQQDTADTNSDGAVDANDAVLWCDALVYCDNLMLAGHDDWKLPNLRELESIIDYGRIGSIDPVFQPIPEPLPFGFPEYWSSTSTGAGAWHVVFSFATLLNNGGRSKDTHKLYVRAVRTEQQEKACVSTNGDTDGDGVVGMPDAVTILSHLFLGNPPRLPSLCNLSDPVTLPATGQTQCYNIGGSVISCSDSACPGQDAAYAAGCPYQGRFTDNGDGTVTDGCTGLMWQKQTADVNGDGRISVDGDSVTWCEAIKYCENVTFAGYNDWRLPNVREALSIMAYGVRAIDPIFLKEEDSYWTSTVGEPEPHRAWVIYSNGVARFGSSQLWVRAVRNGS